MKSSLSSMVTLKISLLLSLLLPPVSVRAATVVWTNNVGGNWSDATNWSPNGVPASGDTVFITNSGTYAVVINVAATLAGLTAGSTNGGAVTLNLATPTLTLNGTSSLETNTVFNFSGGALDGSGELVVNGAFNWTGGTMQGSGQTTFGATSTPTLSGGNHKYLNARKILLQSTLPWTGAGYLYAGYGANFSLVPGAMLDLQGEQYVVHWGGAYATNSNGGIVRKSAGTGSCYLQWQVFNALQYQVLSGTLDLNAGGNSAGQFAAASGATLNFGGNTHFLNAGVSFSGSGTNRIMNGTVNFTTPFATAATFELAVSGVLDGTNNLTFDGVFNWTGGTMQGSGSTTFSASSSPSMYTGNHKYLQARTLTLFSTMPWTGTGFLYAGYGGNFNIQPGATLDLQGEQYVVHWGGAYATNSNGGTLKKSSGSGSCYLQWQANNSGLYQVLSGTLDLNAGGNSPGQFNTSAGATLNFGGNTHYLNAGVSFSGSGTNRIQSGTVNFTVPFYSDRIFELGVSGALDGTNDVAFGGIFTWTGGSMLGSGSTTLTNSSSPSMSTGNHKYLQTRTVRLYSTMPWTGTGFLYAGYGADFRLLPGAVLDLQGEQYVVHWGGAYATNSNGGTVRKSAGGGSCYLQWQVFNAALYQVLSGTLDLNAGGSSAGQFDAGAGSTLNFGGNTHFVNAGANFSGAGLHRAQNGTVYFTSPITIAPRFELGVSGAIDGPADVNFTGIFNWTGGNMTGGGSTTFTNSCSPSLTGGNTKYLQTRTVRLYSTMMPWAGTGYLYAGYGGNFIIQPGATLDLQGEQYVVLWGGAYATNTVLGTLKKSAGTASCYVNWQVNNAGLVQAQSGTLDLIAGGTSTGQFDASAGATLNFGGNTHFINAGAGFSGAGTNRAMNGSVYFNSPISISTIFELANLGAIDGPTDVNFKGIFNWTGGSMTGSGSTTLTNSSTPAMFGGNHKYLRTRTLRLHSTLPWSGAGFLYAGYGANLNIRAGGTFDLQGAQYVVHEGGAYATNNSAGLMKKSAGSYCYNQWVVNNTGTTRAEAGTWEFNVAYTQTAGLTELAGGNLAGVLLDIQGGLLTGSGNIAGNVRNAAQVAPGTGVGLLSISNYVAQSYTSTSNSLVTFQIGGLNPATQHDQIRLNNGTATLDGTLRAVLANGYIPTAGNTYTVMVFTARSGQFTNFSFPDYQFGVVHTPNHVILVASNALPAVQLTGVPMMQLVCTPFELQTSASDLDGTVTNLSVYLGSDLLASFPDGSPRTLSVENDFPGLATFTARATDNKGAQRETNYTTLYTNLPVHLLHFGGPRTNGVFKICMLGEAGSNYLMLATTNVSLKLSNWTSLGLMENTNGIWRTLDNGTLTNRAYRFYRAQQQ